MASMKKGSIASITIKVAVVYGTLPLIGKKSGATTTDAILKHTSCPLVRVSAALLFTFVRSLGTVTYANKTPSFGY